MFTTYLEPPYLPSANGQTQAESLNSVTAFGEGWASINFDTIPPSPSLAPLGSLFSFFLRARQSGSVVGGPRRGGPGRLVGVHLSVDVARYVCPDCGHGTILKHTNCARSPASQIKAFAKMAGASQMALAPGSACAHFGLVSPPGDEI
ncbi:hypothetical protein MTO96_009960 [Rhipicephalus appendiculatus]